jgi:hypothetical protein
MCPPSNLPVAMGEAVVPGPTATTCSRSTPTPLRVAFLTHRSTARHQSEPHDSRRECVHHWPDLARRRTKPLFQSAGGNRRNFSTADGQRPVNMALDL